MWLSGLLSHCMSGGMRLLSVHAVGLRMWGPRFCPSNVNKQRLRRLERLSRSHWLIANCHLEVKLIPTMEMNHCRPSGSTQALTTARVSRGEVRWEQVHGQLQSAVESGILCCSSFFFFPQKPRKIPTTWAGANFLRLPRHYAVVKVFSSFLCHFFRPHEHVSALTPAASLPAAVLNMSGQIIRSLIGKLDRAAFFFFFFIGGV